jgi:hypothetical protein
VVLGAGAKALRVVGAGVTQFETERLELRVL